MQAPIHLWTLSCEIIPSEDEDGDKEEKEDKEEEKKEEPTEESRKRKSGSLQKSSKPVPELQNPKALKWWSTDLS